jgi:hypothetical protein
MAWWGRREPVARLPRALVVHSLAHAVAALTAAKAAGIEVTLISPARAGSVVGPGFFAELIRQAREAVPGVRAVALLDCQHAPGRAMAAVTGKTCDGVIYTGSHETLLKLADIGMEQGMTVLDHRPEAIDLIDHADPLAAATQWLARG